MTHFRQHKNVSGATVIETLVAASILLLVFGAVYSVLRAGVRYLQQAEAYQTSQQQAVIGMRKMLSELQNSNLATINVNPPIAPVPPVAPGVDHLVFLSAESPGSITGAMAHDASTGALQWQKWVCFYRNGNNELWRAEDALSSPVTLPPSPTPPDLLTFQALSSPAARVLARHIDTLSFTLGATNNWIVIELSSRVATSSDKFTSVRLQSGVRLQN